MKDFLSFNIFAEVCGDLCGVESDSNDHPNKLKFTGTLLIVDEPSTRPPNGADGHRIFVPKAIAKKHLDTLIGMGLNYLPGKLSGHQPRHKVGVITKAWLDGNKVMCSGTIWAKDFPEAKRELKSNGLGMSMELANVLVKNKSDPIWTLTDFHFTGATVLYKNAAAYQKTSLAAASAELEQIIGGLAMADRNKKSKHKPSGKGQLVELVTILSSNMTKAIKEGLQPFGEKLEEISASVDKNFKNHGKAISELAASATSRDINAEEDSEESISAAADSSDYKASGDSVEAEASDELEAAADSSDSEKKSKKKIHAAKKKDEDSDESSSSSMDSSDDELDAELEKLSAPAKGTKAGPDEESADPELGKLNKNAKSKGNKTYVNASAGVHKLVRLSAAASKRIGDLKAETKKLRNKLRKEVKSRKELESNVEELQAQVENFTENNIHSKAMPADVRMLLSKSGHNIEEIQASGRKFTVEEVDEMFASAPVTLSPTERMTIKNHMLQHEMMEMGEVRRFK